MSRVLPILFNGDMVRAILDGRKTVTRRLIKPQPTGSWQDNIELMSRAPYQPGDILYVRETWCLRYDGEKYFYKADKNTKREEKRLIDYDHVSWKPSIHMPKEAARIWLKVKDVRVDRLNDITDEQAREEGFAGRKEFIAEFLKMYHECTEESWLWVIEFERCEKPNESPYAWNDAINKIVGGAICD